MADSDTPEESVKALLRPKSREGKAEKYKVAETPLFLAVGAGNYVAVREILSHGHNAAEQVKAVENGDTALHVAVRRKDLEMMRLLVDHKGDVNQQNSAGQTVLHVAAGEGDDSMVKFLTTMKCKSDILDNRNRTALHIAARKGHANIVEILLDKFKADAHLRTEEGHSILHLATLGGHVDASVAVIKRSSALLRLPNKEGALPLHFAAKKGYYKIVKVLLEKGVPVDSLDKNGYTALNMAVLNRKHLVAQLLLGFGADVEMVRGKDKESNLHMAAKTPGGEMVVDVLIKTGANVDVAKRNGETAMHLASRIGNLAVIQLLIKEKAAAARRCQSGEIPLHLACANGHYEVAQALANAMFTGRSFQFGKLVLNVENDKGETAVHYICKRSKVDGEDNENNVKIIKLLLHHGGNLTMRTKKTKENPIHYAARSGNAEIVEAIFSTDHVSLHVLQSVINSRTEIGASPLYLASQLDHLGVVLMLLEQGAREDVCDEIGSTALHKAAEGGHVDVARVLLDHKAYVDVKTKIGTTPLHISAERGHEEFVKLLIQTYQAAVDVATADNKRPLHLAAMKGQLGVCRILLEFCADDKAVDNKGMTPVHYAAQNDRGETVKLFYEKKPDTLTRKNAEDLNALQIAANEGSMNVLEVLLEADFGRVSVDKGVLRKPLQLAARAGRTNVVEYLIKAGASVTEEDPDGMSVLLLAAKFGQLKVIDMLWGQLAFDRASKKNGLTALHVAAMYGQTEVVKETLSKLPSIGTKKSECPAERKGENDYGYTPLHLAVQKGDIATIRVLLNYSGVRVDATTTLMGLIPLHIAAENGHIEAVSLLISKSADQLYAKDKLGRTALHLAAVNAHKEIVTLLVSQGSDTNAQDNNGNTPLHLASDAGHIYIVKLLIENGANTLVENKDGRFALSYASFARHTKVMEFLISSTKLNHEKMQTDKKFLFDLMICSRSNDHQMLKDFVLSSPAPIYTASLLSSHYLAESERIKEYAVDYRKAAEECEMIAKDFITITCAEDSEILLNATDYKNVAFVDFLLERKQKECVAHPFVQQYITDIWYGGLVSWKVWKFIILFLAALFIPFVWVYLTLPFKNKYSRIPVIKFICRFISHLYLMSLLILTVDIPCLNNSTVDLHPHPYEWLLLLWILGMLIAELTRSQGRIRLEWIPVIVVILGLLATLLHGIAVVFTGEVRIELIFARNQLLGLSLLLCMVQLLDFLSIHHLFGPWGVIIGHLVIDVLRFITIALIFGVGFALQLGAVFKPLTYAPANITDHYTVDKIAEQLFLDVFGLSSINKFDGTNLTDKYPVGAFEISKTIFGVFNVLCLLVLVNLLIAMMSDTYQRIHDRSDVEWKFGRAKLIRNMEVEPARPVPLNVFITVVKFFKALAKMRCNCCKPGSWALLRKEVKGMEEHHGRSSRRESLAPLARHHTLRISDDNGRESPKEDKKIQSVVDWGKIVVKYYNIKGKLETGASAEMPGGNDTTLRLRKRTTAGPLLGKDADAPAKFSMTDASTKMKNVMNVTRL